MVNQKSHRARRLAAAFLPSTTPHPLSFQPPPERSSPKVTLSFPQTLYIREFNSLYAFDPLKTKDLVPLPG